MYHVVSGAYLRVEGERTRRGERSGWERERVRAVVSARMLESGPSARWTGRICPGGHPDRPGYLAMQSEGSSLLGLMIWLTENYTQALFLTRWVGRTSHCLSPDGYKFLKYALMHLIAHPFATHWGGSTCRSLELSSPIKQPYSTEDQEWGLYFNLRRERRRRAQESALASAPRPCAT